MQPRILAFTDWYLPSHKGGGSVSAVSGLIELLGDQFSFYVFTRDRDQRDKHPYAGVPLGRWEQVGKAQVLYTSDLSLRNVRRRILEVVPEVIYLNSFFSLLTIKTLFLRRLGLLPPASIVLAPRGEFSGGALNLKRYRKWLYRKTALPVGLYRDLIWQASSPLEKEQIHAVAVRNGGKHSCHVQIAPDIPGPHLFQQFTSSAKREKQCGAARFVFLSRIARTKNLHFALEVLASIAGQVELDIYGPVDNDGYWEVCRERIRSLPGNISVHYCGSVARQSVSSKLAQHQFFLLPTLGESFGYVILEALAAGCPVIVSDRTIWRDLSSKGGGWDLPLDDRRRWQQVMQQCVDMNREAYKELSCRARRFVEQWVSSDDSCEKSRRLFHQAVEFNSARKWICGKVTGISR